MKLTLKVDSFCGSPASDSRTRSFEQFPVIVGRSSSCDFVLTDVNRYVSSNHATFFVRDGALMIEDTSANGTYLNAASKSIGRDNPSVVAHDGTVTIGDYVLSVEIECRDVHPDPFGPEADAIRPAPSSVAAPYDPFKGAEEEWPLADSQHLDSRAWDHDVLFDDMDDTSAQQGVESSQPVNPEVSDDEAWADWPPEPPQAQIERAPRGGAAGESREPETSNNEPRHHDQHAAIKVDYPEERSNRADGRREDVQKHTPPPPPSSTGEPYRAAIEVLLAASGIKPEALGSTADRDALEASGRLLQLAVAGMMSLLDSRAEWKDAIKDDVTRLGRRHNNPLKFAHDPEDALAKLLSSDHAGYLDADSAMAQAVDDLQLHQLAMLDGMKAAVESLLREFDPQALEKKLASDHPIAASIPYKREAEVWRLFQEHYGEIRNEAVSNFRDLFGKELRLAYQRRLHKSGREPDF